MTNQYVTLLGIEHRLHRATGPFSASPGPPRAMSAMTHMQDSHCPFIKALRSVTSRQSKRHLLHIHCNFWGCQQVIRRLQRQVLSRVSVNTTSSFSETAALDITDTQHLHGFGYVAEQTGAFLLRSQGQNLSFASPLVHFLPMCKLNLSDGAAKDTLGKA